MMSVCINKHGITKQNELYLYQSVALINATIDVWFNFCVCVSFCFFMFAHKNKMMHLCLVIYAIDVITIIYKKLLFIFFIILQALYLHFFHLFYVCNDSHRLIIVQVAEYTRYIFEFFINSVQKYCRLSSQGKVIFFPSNFEPDFSGL